MPKGYCLALVGLPTWQRRDGSREFLTFPKSSRVRTRAARRERGRFGTHLMPTMFLRSVRDLPTKLGRTDVRCYLPEIDGLRFVAIGFVLVWHASLRAARYLGHAGSTGGPVTSWYYHFPHGEVGVLLFFFISGFVVSQPFLLRPRQEWRVRSYYRRRVVRIYPPYLVSLTLCFIALGVLGTAPTDANAFNSNIPLSHSFAASLVYLHGLIYDAPSRLNPPMWSLEIEVAFYIVLPLLMAAYARVVSRTRRMAALATLLLVGVATSSLLMSGPDVDLRFRWGLPYHAYLFGLGVLAADLIGDPATWRVRKGWTGDAAFAAGLLFIIKIGLLMTRHDAEMPSRSYALAIQLTTIGALGLIFWGAFHGSRASRFLSSGWIRLTGVMCYSIYLTHIVLMTAIAEVIERILAPRGTFVVYAIYLGTLIPVSIVVGLIFYVMVERPFARRRSRPAGRRSLRGHISSVSDGLSCVPDSGVTRSS